MAAKTSTRSASLVPLFDDVVASTDILCQGTENLFAEFVGHQVSVHSKVLQMSGQIAKLKSEKEANEIKLKHARSSFDYQMQKRAEAEEALKQYEKQFTIILELLGDNKLESLTADERRSLALLKDGRRSSPFVPRHSQELSVINESSVVLSPSDVSVDPGDLDENVSILRDGKKWKRRRTASLDSPPPKKKRSNDGTSSTVTTATTSSEEGEGLVTPTLSPPAELNKVAPLEKQFKKPPPMGNRRRPSNQHFKQSTMEVTDLDNAMEAMSSSPPLFDEPATEPGDPVPTAPPPLYPVLGGDTPDGPSSPQVNTDTDMTPVASPVVHRSQSDFNMQRQHTFFTKTALKLESVNCEVCNSKIRIAHSYLKCQDCRMSSHPKCRAKAKLPCVPCVPTPKKKLQNLDLAAFCPRNIPRVPAIIVHCVNEIERRGLTSVGLYRISGSDKVVKELRDRLLRSKGHPSLDKIIDVNALCGVVKDFLRSLREPILTFALHEAFIKAASADTEEEALASTLEAIAQLPPANKDTLAYLILHLQRVASYSSANKMPLPNLVTVFAPTIVGHGSAKPSNADMLRDTKHQTKVMGKLIGISADYWRQYLSPMENPNPATVSPTPSVQSIQSSPALLSPATPELRPVPESPFLGSCHSRAPQTPRLPGLGVTPIVLSHPKRTGNFLPALN